MINNMRYVLHKTNSNLLVSSFSWTEIKELESSLYDIQDLSFYSKDEITSLNKLEYYSSSLTVISKHKDVLETVFGPNSFEILSVEEKIFTKVTFERI